MKKTIKMMLALLLALAMVLSLAACGGNGGNSTSQEADTKAADDSKADDTTADNSGSTGEATKVTFYFPTIYDVSGAPDVLAKLNEYSIPKYGIEYAAEYVSFGNLNSVLNTALTGSDVDVFRTMGGMTLKEELQKGLIIPIQEYWDDETLTSKEVYDRWQGVFTDGCSVDGQLCGIPQLVDYGHYVSLTIDNEVFNAYGKWTAEQDVTLDDISAFLDWCHETYPDKYPIVPNGTTLCSGWTWDPLTDGVGVLGNCSQDTKVHSLFDDEDYILFCRWAREQFEKGYITKDIMSNSESALGQVKAGVGCCYFDWYGISTVDGCTRVRAMSEPFAACGNIGTACYCISANSLHKKEAYRALELIYEDEVISRFINNGIEGVHYTVNEDGTFSYLEGKDPSTCGYGMAALKWCMPGSEISYPNVDDGPTYFTDLYNWCKDTCEYSVIDGWVFDPSAVEDEWTNCKTVYTNYWQTIMSGSVDVDEFIKQAKDEMAANGEDKVIAEKQRQIDEFLANKK